MQRSFDSEDMRKALEPYPDLNPPDYDHKAWCENPYNVMLVDGDDVALGTFEYPGVYTGHYFFKSRGKNAIRVAKKMLRYMFEEQGAKVIRGVTKLDNEKARWMNRYLGFDGLGYIETVDGMHELFCLHKDKFYQRHNDVRKEEN